MGKLKKDITESEIRTSGFDKVAREVIDISKSIEDLNSKNKDLRAERAKLIATGKKESDEYKNLSKSIKENNAQISGEIKKRQELESSLNLNQMSYSQLKSKSDSLKRSLYNTSKELYPEKWKTYNDELKKVDIQMRKVGTGVNSVRKQMTQGFTKGFSNIFSFSIVGAVAASIATLKTSIVEMFALAQKSQGDYTRNLTVLGDSYGYVAMQADKVAQKMGTTKNQFIANTTATADLLVPLDFARDKAAKMAASAQSLAGALNEWTGGRLGVAEVSNIITKAMLGENEQLKQLGIAIRKDSEEYIKLTKEKMAVENTTKAQAEAMATLELIYKKSIDAQTAYAGSGNQLLRTQNSLRSGWQGMKESLADYFALSEQQRLEKQALEYNAVAEAITVQRQETNVLIETYSDLKSKSSLTSDEQERLNSTIQQIGRIAPEAVTQYNELGQALDVNVDALNRLIEAQEKAAKSSEERVASKVEKQLKKQVEVIKNTQEDMEYYSSLMRDAQESMAKGGDYAIKAAQAYQSAQSIHKRLSQKLSDNTLDAKQNILILSKYRDNYADIASAIGTSAEIIERLGGSKNQPIIPSAPKDLIQTKETELAKAKEIVATTEAEVKARNKNVQDLEKELTRLKNLGIVKDGPKEKETYSFDKDAKFMTDKIALRHKLNANEISSEDRYNQALLALEIESLERRIGLNKDKGDELHKLQSDLADKKYQQTKSEQSRLELLLFAAYEGTDETNSVKRYAKETADHEKRLKDLGLFNKNMLDMTNEELNALENLEKIHYKKLQSIYTDRIVKEFQTKSANRIRSINEQKIVHNNELQDADTFEKKKTLIEKNSSAEEASRIRTDREADRWLKSYYRDIEQKEARKHLEALIIEYTQKMGELNKVTENGISLGSMNPDDVARFQAIIDDLKKQLSELNGITSTSDQNDLDKVDILGYSAKDWQDFFDNIASGEEGIKSWEIALGAIGNAFSAISNLMTAIEQKEFKEYEKTANKKKKALDGQLKQGLISQDRYNTSIQQIDEDTEIKRQEMERKQAVRQKAMAVFQALTSTAMAIMMTAGTLGFPAAIPFIAAVGALGAIQVATILATPIPGAEAGGYLDVERQQDGKHFNAEFAPQKRGYVQRPTVIVGENGSEYVIPTDALQNPDVASFVNTLEAARIRGNFRDVSLFQSVNQQAIGRQYGGRIPADATIDMDNPSMNRASNVDLNNTVSFLNVTIAQLIEQLRKGIRADVSMLGKKGLVEQWARYESITKQSQV